MATVVKFFTDRQPRILEGIDPEPFRNDGHALIDPIIPPGVPPHFWKLGEGKIEVVDYISGCENVPLDNHPHVRVDHHHSAKIENIIYQDYALSIIQGTLIALISSALTILALHCL